MPRPGRTRSRRFPERGRHQILRALDASLTREARSPARRSPKTAETRRPVTRSTDPMTSLTENPRPLPRL